MSKSKLIAKQLFDDVKWKRYNYLINKETYKILADVEAQRGKLCKSMVRKCDEYAEDILGGKVFSPGLQLFTALNGGFQEGWLPENYYGRFVVEYAQGDYGKVSYLKPMTRYIFRSDLFPDLVSYVNGIWLDSYSNVVLPDQVREVLFANRSKVVFKSDANFLQGLGIHFFTKENFDIHSVLMLGNGVFQDFIYQHPFFEEIMPDSVATIRLTTAVDREGQVSVRSSFLRVGRSGQPNVKAKSEMNVLADAVTGQLDQEVYYMNYQYTDRHPDTGYQFGGKTLPCYQKCVDAVVSLHATIPQVRCIGWDLVVDKNEDVKVMEWNGADNGMRIAQGVKGAVFADLGWDKLHLLKENPLLVY